MNTQDGTTPDPTQKLHDSGDFETGIEHFQEKTYQDECARALAETREAKLRTYERLVLEGQASFENATDRSASLITDLDEAQSLHDHREKLIVTDMVARKLYEAHRAKDTGDQETFNRIVDEVAEDLEINGGLWWRNGYSVNDERERIRDEMILCVRSGARLMNVETGHYNDFENGAEMRTRFAAPGANKLVTHIPGASDDAAYYELAGQWAHVAGKDRPRQAACRMRKRPSSTGVIEDVYTYDQRFAGQRVASMARTETFRLLEQDVNAQRDQGERVDTLIANTARFERMRIIASKQGAGVVEMPNGGASNWRSIKMHSMTQHPDYIGYLAWSLPTEKLSHTFTPENENAPVTVEFDIGWETVLLEKKENFQPKPK